MKRFCTILLLAAFVLPVFAGGASEEGGAPEEFVIGYQAIPNGEIIAKAMGWNEETLGVKVTWVQMSSASEVNVAMAAGSLDVGLVGSSGVSAAVANDIPIEVIWIHDVIGDNEALVAKKGSGISDVADLLGKKVAVPFGSTTHYHLLTALGLEGINPENVTILDMQPADILAAWQRGDIDATFVWEPTLAKAIELDGEVILTSRSLAEQGYLTGDICVARKEFAQAHPDIIAAYLKNQIKAVELFRSDKNAAAQAVADEFDIPQKEALRQMNSLVLLSGQEQFGASYLGSKDNVGDLAQVFKDTADFLAEQKTIKSAPPLSAFEEVVNPSYLQQALK